MSNENRTTAFVEGETLSYQREGEHYQLRVGTPAWYAWLRTATLFRVRSAFGTFSVRREQPTASALANSTVSIWARRRR